MSAYGYDRVGNQPAATGQLVLELRKPWGSWGMITPAAEIDGHPVSVRWGSNPLVVPAGTRQVCVSCTYLWTYGRATDLVPVGPGQQVIAHYSPPLFTLMAGRLGPNRMPYRGLAVLLIIVGVLVAAIVVVIVGARLS